MDFKQTVKPQLADGFEIVERYDDGTQGSNEVARVRSVNFVHLEDGRDVVVKVMPLCGKHHQRRKALTEVVFYLLDKLIGGQRVVPDLYAELFELTGAYAEKWGVRNPEGHPRICQVVRAYAPCQAGDEWRGEVYGQLGDLGAADRHCQSVIETHPDAEKISLLDLLTINQDRSARNWVTDHGARFYAIDNGMAWFHEFPNGDMEMRGCAIDDVLLQKEPWQFIAGVFSTSWAGRPLSAGLLADLHAFDETQFRREVDQAAIDLGFPPGMGDDWRFDGVLRRLRWMAREGRQPFADEYRAWYEGGYGLFTPSELVESGGQFIWKLEHDYDGTR
jgi:hypothetical protein